MSNPERKLKVPFNVINTNEIFNLKCLDLSDLNPLIDSESHGKLTGCLISYSGFFEALGGGFSKGPFHYWELNQLNEIIRTVGYASNTEDLRECCTYCNICFEGKLKLFTLKTPDEEKYRMFSEASYEVDRSYLKSKEEQEKLILRIQSYQKNNGLPKIIQKLDQAQNQIVHLRKKIIEERCCPICGKQLLPKSFRSYGYEEEINSSESGLAKEMRDNFLVSCDFPVKCEQSAEQIQSVKNDLERMKEYVLTLLDLEINIHSTSKRLEQLYWDRISNERQIRGDQALTTIRETKKHQAQIDHAEQKLKDAQDFLTRNESSVPCPVQVDYPNEPIEPTYATPYFFNRKKVETRNQVLRETYEKALEEYKIATEKCRKEEKRLKIEAKEEHKKLIQTARENVSLAKTKLEKARSDYQNERKKIAEKMSTIRIPSTVIRDISAKDIEEAETYLKKAIECRNQLYSCNIIFPKYRDAVALSMFYEYFSSGRCTTLEGPNGAYNIYEMETRSNLIISQLNTVIESLETIKQNQYMIYSKLSSVNSKLETMGKTFDTMASTLNSMDGKLDKIEKNSAVIAHNSAVAAYYSKVNAELTNALGYMVALK